MDIRFHLGILWRWKWVLAGGLVLATAAAFLSTFKPSSSGVEWRAEPTYQSFARVMVTQPGFPLGRATLPGADPTTQLELPKPKERFAPPERFTGLAEMYAYVASSAQIRDLITPKPLEDQISVVPALGSQGDALPLLEVTTTGKTPKASEKVSAAVISALRKYLTTNGRRSNVPTDQQVHLVVLNPPKAGELIAGRSPTMVVMVWLLGAVLTFALVYVLENLYPRKPVAAVPHAEDLEDGEQPKTNGSAPEVELELGEHWAAIRRARSAERSS